MVPKVRDMEEGDWGYIIPWKFDRKSRRVIDESLVIREKSSGTADLKITKLKSGHFDFWPDRDDYWEPFGQ